MNAERGFTLVETTVAAAIGLLLGWQLLAMTHTMTIAAARLDDSLRARSSADRLEERLSSDAAGAWSVFVPATAADGKPNADGHEVDFATEDGSHVPHWWAYAYDAGLQRVTRYAYVPGGSAVAGERFDGLDELHASAHPVSDLGRRGNAAYDPLFSGSSAAAVDVDFGWNPAALGGNHLVAIRIAAAGIDRTLLLSAATAPSRFTVVVPYTPPPVRR